jgi:hypothetical protein
MVWYFADPAAQAFPSHHLYGSRNWSTGDAGSNPVGEVYAAPRPWRNGSAPVSLPGDHFCGPEPFFDEGVPFSAAADEPLDENGDPACCTGLPVLDGPRLPDPLPPGVKATFGMGTTFFVLTGVAPNRVYVNDGDPPEEFLQFEEYAAGRIRDCPRWRLADVFFGHHNLELVSFDNTTFTSVWVSDAFTFGFPPGTLFTVSPFP